MMVERKHTLSLGTKLILFVDGDGFQKSKNAWGLGRSHPLREGKGHQKDSAELNVFQREQTLMSKRRTETIVTVCFFYLTNFSMMTSPVVIATQEVVRRSTINDHRHFTKAGSSVSERLVSERLLAVSVSNRCCKKLPHTQWLETKVSSGHSGGRKSCLSLRGLIWRFRQGWFFLEALRENVSLSFPVSRACIPWHMTSFRSSRAHILLPPLLLPLTSNFLAMRLGQMCNPV